MKTIIIKNIDSIRPSAAEFITFINDSGRKIFAFEGSMGAGKTTFIKAICEELGVEDMINSPTFSIINEYRIAVTGEPVYHFDFYRVKNTNEAQNTGAEDCFHSGALCFIEWPETVKELLPADTVSISIEELPDGSRHITW
jgi:tRNA threonylcarbamoyladenosine biosynthesis protein TsaE